jgi:hypothetical protein
MNGRLSDKTRAQLRKHGPDTRARVLAVADNPRNRESNDRIESGLLRSTRRRFHLQKLRPK